MSGVYGRFLLLLLLLTILPDKSLSAAHTRARLGGAGAGKRWLLDVFVVGWVCPPVQRGQSREPLPVMGSCSIQSCVSTQEL